MKLQFLLCCFIGSISLVEAQNLEIISGTVAGKDDIENIHVINKSSKRFTTTNAKGAFSIEAKLQDTIVFTAIQYTTQEIIIDRFIISNNSMHIYLDEEVNELSEVIVGKILTGNLMLDIGNSTIEPEINFYNVGIPGYKGKRATKTERILSQAKSGILNTVVNGISGRTKMLKAHVKFEKNDVLITQIRQRLSNDLFSKYSLEESNQMDFWYFCSESPEFITRCKGQTDIAILDYLIEKYKEYIRNLKSE
ncbi:carboxypeptidase-like regulatory domain-containing protein [uncultured Formosa sp.]|uniref:carboxypeptidase-like regulatory domain-containing protein n=1 Tax=uncultured Formosa sp. TaxID=255435 RepID=UPI002631C135|nr:carboxypeptidase-like regulatory domain-containing protein [uncultured Formosa sp.]